MFNISHHFLFPPLWRQHVVELWVVGNTLHFRILVSSEFVIILVLILFYLLYYVTMYVYVMPFCY